MSTTAIRRLVEAMQEAPDEEVSGWADAAMEEVKAIERMAPIAIAAFTGDIHVFSPAQIDLCARTLESIAEDAP